MVICGETNPNLIFLWVQMVFQGLLLSGTNEVSLDVKGRLAVPVKNREILKEESDGQCVVTRSLFDKCLWLYPVDEWQKVVASLGELPSISDPLCRTIQRIVLGSAVFLTLDAQGRILLPQELRAVASLDKKAYMIGFNNKFELWSEENYKARMDEDLQMLQNASASISAHGVLEGLKL